MGDQKFKISQAMVMHAFDPSTQEEEAGRISEFEASLVYRGSSKTTRATQRNHVLKNKIKKKENEGWRDGSVVKSSSRGPEFNS